ncbi:hypothetical protein AUK22_00030 [bacterium CG2_30_54_10]|nr:MAG: hypothetical protein AUK22_00030 [bacterium CG2_30_54_10]
MTWKGDKFHLPRKRYRFNRLERQLFLKRNISLSFEMNYPLNNSGELNDSWHKRFLRSVEMTASFVIPNECEESRIMLRIS